MRPPHILGRGAAFGVSLTAAAVSLCFPSAALADGIVLTGFSSGVVSGAPGSFPNTQLAVGAREIVHLTNGAAVVYNKSGVAQGGIRTLDQFWSDAGLSSVTGTFNPRVVYDPVSRRYYATALDSPRSGANANNLLLAVSKTAHPQDGWKGYQLPVNQKGGDHFGDFDGLGFNREGVFLSLSAYQSQNGPFVGTTTFAIEKSSLLSLPSALTMMASYENSAVSAGFIVQPIVNYDNSVTAADKNGSFVARYFNNSFAVSRFTGSLADGAAIYEASGQNLFASHYSPPPAEGAAQRGTSATIDAGDNILSSAISQRGGNVYLVQGVSAPIAQGGHAAIRLLVYRAASNAILLDTLISDPIHDLYTPSVAVNDSGGIVLGYTASGPDIYASAYAVAGQLNAARTGVTFETPLLLAAGQGIYDNGSGGFPNRWGDYSATWVDPTDPTRFWTAQEYVTGKNQWGTYIAEIGLGGVIPSAAPDPASLGLLILGGITLCALRRRTQKP